MRLFLPLVATLLLAAMPLPVQRPRLLMASPKEPPLPAKASLGAPVRPVWVLHEAPARLRGQPVEVFAAL